MNRLTALRCLASAILACAGLQASAATPPHGSTHIPAAWRLYAATVSRQLQTELSNSHDPAAIRFHRFLDDLANTSTNTPTPIVKLWIGQDGKIRHAEFNSLGNAAANADLSHIIVTTTLPTAPPPNLPQPLILRLQLTYPI